MRGQSRFEIVQKEFVHGCQWNREAHPFVIQREQAPSKLMYKRVQIGCQSRDEWRSPRPHPQSDGNFVRDKQSGELYLMIWFSMFFTALREQRKNNTNEG